MDLRRERIVLETDRHRVEGLLTLPREGHRSRLSDYINRRDQEFFTILEAKVSTLNGDDGWETAVLMVARGHVRLIVPEEAPAE